MYKVPSGYSPFQQSGGLFGIKNFKIHFLGYNQKPTFCVYIRVISKIQSTQIPPTMLEGAKLDSFAGFDTFDPKLDF